MTARWVRGGLHKNARLNAEIARQICAEYGDGGTITMTALARRYGVTRQAVAKVLDGETWSAATGRYASRGYRFPEAKR